MVLISEPAFTVEVFQNEYLEPGQHEVSAVVTVTAPQTLEGLADGGDAAEIIIVDCSASMATPAAKMSCARQAVAAAVDVIGDGVAFAIVAGAERAWQVYPAEGGLAVASRDTRKAAIAAVAGLAAEGSTAMGRWLRLAYELFVSHPARLRHAILLAGSRGEAESLSELDAAIAQCEGIFSCDCRGVGTDWSVSELRRISSALLGTVDIVPDLAGLTAELVSLMETAMSRRVADVSLRLWTPRDGAVRFLKQIAPTVEDLTARRGHAGPQPGDYPAGAWAAGETRDYHLAVRIVPASVGQEMLAARVSLVTKPASGTQIVLGEGLVTVIWTDDATLSSRISEHVAHYTGQSELAQAIQDGLKARASEEWELATAKLGQAIALALHLERADMVKLLAATVQVVDPATGTVRLREGIDAADSMVLDARSNKAMIYRGGEGPGGHAFISYVREDSAEVDRLQHALEMDGVRVWRDTAELYPGEDWRARIRHAITSNALVFIACFSGSSLARQMSYQNEELALAIDQLRLRHPDVPWLIPVRFDDCEIPDYPIGGGRTLKTIQHADLFGEHRAAETARLVTTVLRILGKHPGSPAAT
jgi:hypothetical protein